jgi:hypothetical protein
LFGVGERSLEVAPVPAEADEAYQRVAVVGMAREVVLESHYGFAMTSRRIERHRVDIGIARRPWIEFVRAPELRECLVELLPADKGDAERVVEPGVIGRAGKCRPEDPLAIAIAAELAIEISEVRGCRGVLRAEF